MVVSVRVYLAIGVAVLALSRKVAAVFLFFPFAFSGRFLVLALAAF